MRKVKSSNRLIAARSCPLNWKGITKPASAGVGPRLVNELPVPDNVTTLRNNSVCNCRSGAPEKAMLNRSVTRKLAS